MTGRTVAVFLVLAASPAAGLAQEQTLIVEGVESGGWGGPVVMFSDVNGQFAVFAGGRGGWIINHAFVLGGAGYGLTNDIRFFEGGPSRQFNFGYGGGDIEAVIASDKLVHATVNVMIGGGGISPLTGEPADAVFVLQPQGSVDLNVTSFFRMSFGGGYRYVSGVDYPGLRNAMFSSAFGALVFKFGKF